MTNVFQPHEESNPGEEDEEEQDTDIHPPPTVLKCPSKEVVQELPLGGVDLLFEI